MPVNFPRIIPALSVERRRSFVQWEFLRRCLRIFGGRALRRKQGVNYEF
jgi:hypothetical protein